MLIDYTKMTNLMNESMYIKENIENNINNI